jgi:cytochrome c55X
MITFSRVAVILLFLVVQAEAQVLSSRQSEILHLLKHDCGSCHGMTLGGGLGPALTTEALKDKPHAYLEQVILEGRPGTPMAPWRNFITADEVRWLVNYLKTGDYLHAE